MNRGTPFRAFNDLLGQSYGYSKVGRFVPCQGGGNDEQANERTNERRKAKLADLIFEIFTVSVYSSDEDACRGVASRDTINILRRVVQTRNERERERERERHRREMHTRRRPNEILSYAIIHVNWAFLSLLFGGTNERLFVRRLFVLARSRWRPRPRRTLHLTRQQDCTCADKRDSDPFSHVHFKINIDSNMPCRENWPAGKSKLY